MGKQLDCKRCGTIALEISDEVVESSPISCSSCGAYMGTWGDLQDNFDKQVNVGAFDLEDGNIREH
ncbi:hypothetical protein [Aquibium sp. ELW1220]|uniref:hypothetical protein n=1 Tax=Aquibium sp. ELW1220 TaxID=2976766 RepID=UPI0025B189B0|nr:hypothetical protein [Aquibium sp. ELW1220]MDN2578726.1 hypothetical protein [Aquibium sp. ELW1220]